MNNESQKQPNWTAWILGSILGILVLIGVLMAVLPAYGVWQQGMSGQARLKEAESSRRILVQEAEAKKDASKLLAEAEVERAKGVAKANEIIGQSLKSNEVYLHYLWIHALEVSTSDVIYVPTEANLPILEASRFLKK